MPANRVDAGKGEAERAEKRPEAAAAPEAGKPAGGNPMQAWLPLIGAVVLLPVAAYLVTSFVLLPKLQKGLGITPPATAAAASGHGAPAKEASGHGASAKEASGGHGESESGGHGASAEGGSSGPGGREQVPLTKLIVNVSGTSASRILLASLILVGTNPDFRTAVKDHDAQLRDTACGILGTKGIQDLEKPGARNMIRSELITAFNHVLGSTAVQEIYFTDFAIQ